MLIFLADLNYGVDNFIQADPAAPPLHFPTAEQAGEWMQKNPGAAKMIDEMKHQQYTVLYGEIRGGKAYILEQLETDDLALAQTAQVNLIKTGKNSALIWDVKNNRMAPGQ